MSEKIPEKLMKKFAKDVIKFNQERAKPDKPDVAQRAAELFGSRKHDPEIPSIYENVNCAKCGHALSSGGAYTGYHKVSCIPDPIDITDLGKALEVFRGLWIARCTGDDFFKANKLFRSYGWKDLGGVGTGCYYNRDQYHYFLAKVLRATAEQLWEFCILAKESE